MQIKLYSLNANFLGVAGRNKMQLQVQQCAEVKGT